MKITGEAYTENTKDEKNLFRKSVKVTKKLKREREREGRGERNPESYTHTQSR